MHHKTSQFVSLKLESEMGTVLEIEFPILHQRKEIGNFTLRLLIIKFEKKIVSEIQFSLLSSYIKKFSNAWE